jgi:hypothetical protein
VPTQRASKNPEPDEDDEDETTSTPEAAETDLRVKKLIKDALKEYAEENKPAPRRTNPRDSHNPFGVVSQLFGL